MSHFNLFLFGPPRVELNSASIEFQRRKVLALLIYLAVNGQPHSRDALATLFYPDHSQQRARAYLRRDLAVLNTSLSGEWLDTDRELVELKRDGLSLDVVEFRRHPIRCGPDGPVVEIGDHQVFETGTQIQPREIAAPQIHLEGIIRIMIVLRQFSQYAGPSSSRFASFGSVGGRE